MKPLLVFGRQVMASTRSEAFTTINDSIGVLLRSYTRAINRERNRTGSLFRRKTKAECIAKVEGALLKPSLEVKASITLPEQDQITGAEYLPICFDYIHQNPTKAGLAEHPEKWEFPSYVDYCGLRNGKLINRQRAQVLGLHL